MLVLKNTKRCLGWFRVITFPVNITVSVHCCLLLHLLISASVLISELFDFLSVLIMVLKCAYQSVTPTPFVFTLQVSVWRTAGCAFEFPFSNLYHLESKRGSLRLLAMFLYWLYFSGTCSSSLLSHIKTTPTRSLAYFWYTSIAIILLLKPNQKKFTVISLCLSVMKGGMRGCWSGFNITSTNCNAH